MSTHGQKSGAKASKGKDANRFLQTQSYNTVKGKHLRNVQIDLGVSSAGRLNTSSQQQHFSSPSNKLQFQNNVMSRMIAKQTELQPFSSLDGKKVKKPLLRINLEEEPSVERDAKKAPQMDLESPQQNDLLQKDKRELE
jgi:hypothetical protein